MTLCIDIGNTDAVLGFFDQNGTISHKLRVRSKEERYYSYFKEHLDAFLKENIIEPIDKIVLSSVVPEQTSVVEAIVKDVFKAPVTRIRPDLLPEIKVDIENPYELGQDLYANAAYAILNYNSNAVVVDFGTALTFTSVSAEGQIVGVSIVPGLKTAVKALFSSTAQLPEVPLSLPVSVIGKNTIEAIQSGILVGYEGLVRHMLKKIKEQIGGTVVALATGGLSSIITTLQDEFVEVNIDLTLQGLYLISKKIA